MFIHLDKTPECDGRMDRQTDIIALAITAKCGRTVKTAKFKPQFMETIKNYVNQCNKNK